MVPLPQILGSAMNDEINRLRGMRQAALDARVLARVLNDTDRRDSAVGRSGVLCWRIARIATARLRAHPHRAYHRDPGLLEAVVGGFRGLIVGVLAMYRKRPMAALQRELQGLSRVLDDVRSLTLSPDLSDSLGRGQVAMRQLLSEIGNKARMEGGSRQQNLRTETPVAMAPTAARASSPYLAL
jgi:hypothetical protein